MKVHLIRKETIEEFARYNAQSRISFEEWLTKIKSADWTKPADMMGFGNMHLATNKFIFLFAGPVHIRNMMNFVITVNDTQ